MDLSRLEDIVYLATTGTLIALFLVSAVIVLAKGKREKKALDVVLRVFAIIALVASAIFVALFVLLKLDVVKLTVEGERAVFAFGTVSVRLILPRVFELASNIIGVALVGGVLASSLFALIVDCVLAKKKNAKKPAAAKKPMTPEEAKRAAEIERIRRLGAVAVNKADAAASDSAETRSKKKDEPKSKKDEPKKEEPKAEPEKPETASEKTEAAPAKTPEELAKGDIEEPEWLKKPDTDWRTEAARPTTIQGLGGNDESFDSFDAFDASEPEPEPEPDEEDVDEPEVEEEQETVKDDFDYEPDGETEKEPDEPIEELIDVDDDGDPNSEAIGEEDSGPELYNGYNEDMDMLAEEADKPEQEEPVEEESEEEVEETVDEVEEPAEEESVAAEEAAEAEGEEEPAQEDAYYDYYGVYDDDVDRGIYIPRIRTIVRAAGAKRPEDVVLSPKRKPAAKKPAEKAQESPAQAKKKTAKPKSKPAPTPTPAPVEEPKPAAAEKPNAREIDRSRLPVNKRYVILDRKNAVNIFNDYLKDKDNADKARLKSNINTIILK